jgi:hypothetical protein
MLRLLTPTHQPSDTQNIDAEIERWMQATEPVAHPSDPMPPRYSNDMAAAWSVAQRMRALGWTVTITNDPADLVPDEAEKRGGRDAWICVVEVSSNPLWSERYASWAVTAPLAICRVVLDTAQQRRAAARVRGVSGSPSPQVQL